MADASEFVQPLLSQKMSITEENIIKISKAVKAEILADINKLIHARTEPLVPKISKLETENKQLQKDLDALEQYGRRSLVRISGLSERATGDETTTAVRKIMSEIDQTTNQKTSSDHIGLVKVAVPRYHTESPDK